ncbi:MAG: glycosyltransferase [Verrucomicrobiota bacterium]|nr:glycosyltransferase [Verrucomicrobiota bacterium]
MRVILTSHGSTGDIYPIIALGVALRRAGHQVRFATMPIYEREIEAAGLEFLSLCPNWKQADLSYWMGRLQKIRLPLYQLREIFVGALPYISEMIERMDCALNEADLLVSSCLFPMNKSLADRKGVPFATFSFAHQTVPSPDYSPENLALPGWFPRTMRRRWNWLLWQIANFLVDTIVNSTVAKPLRAAGLPKVRKFFSEPAEIVLVGVSEKLMRPPGAEIPPRFRFIGYCRWQAREDPAIDAEIAAFTDGQRVPLLTFGSMVCENPSEVMRRFVKHWPRGKKILMQSGWAEFTAPPGCPHIKVIGKISHDQLFRHASMVIHHGGAGTTASALHAGLPQIVAPHIGDQNFFGGEVERLGCGFRIARKTWPEQLYSATERIAADPAHAACARAAKKILQTENGPARAVGELERFVEKNREEHRGDRSTFSASSAVK